MTKIFLFYIALQSSIAIAFPDMVRHGYASCSACHISPSGGGVLNSYGRAVSSEVLSTYRNENLPNYFLPRLPNWLSYGGDIRYLNATSESYLYKHHRHFWMQSDFELAVSPVPGLWVVGGIGYYDVNFPEKNTRKIEAEQRRNYVLLQLPWNVLLQSGRYFAPFGIRLPDHSLSTRAGMGFNENQETENVSSYIQSRFGEISVTGVLGNSGMVRSSSNKGYQWERASGESGEVLRGTFSFLRTSQVGISALRLVNKEAKNIRTAYGAFGTLSIIPQIYTMFEIDQLLETGKKRDTIWVARQGIEPYRGIHLLATYEGLRSQYSAWRYALQLFPVSHLELQAEYQRKVTEIGLKSENFVFLFHYYL